MEIIKMKKEAVEGFDLPNSVTDVYYLKNELETIGYGFINYNAPKEIEIFVKDEYRGEECGKELFQTIYNDFLNDVIHLEVELENYPMIKIVEEFNGINLGTNEGVTRYIIKKN